MKKFILLLLLFSCMLSAHAGSITRLQAMQTANSFFAARGLKMGGAPVSGIRKAGQTDSDDTEPYYVFNADGGNGFVIVSGNDLTEQILGYTDSGTFNEDSIPDNMKSWLQYYADEIKWVEAKETDILQAKQKAAAKKVTKTHHSIAPLLTCTWNQGDPYNRSCPIYYNEDGSTGTSATGCIATALVQVKYVYKYPSEVKSAIPSHSCSYSTTSGTKTVTLPAIPAGTKIDWDNMLDNYDGNETDEQIQAVADLNLFVGQAVQMGYGASSGSSYWNADIMYHTYFGYDDSVYVVRSTNFDIDEWFEMIYSEVEAGYPVAYGGTSSGGGHAFVLDGFDGEGLFHVNWGWGGGSNGYFRLTVLDSSDTSGSGLSSSADGFTMGQDAVLSLRSEDDGITDTRSLNLTITSAAVSGKNIRATYKNESDSDNSYECSLLTKNSYGEFIPVGEIVETDDWASGSSKSFKFDVSDCFSQPGEYKLTPAGRVLGSDKWYPLWTLNTDYIMATVDDDLNVSLSRHFSASDVEVTNWDFTGNMVAGTKQYVTVSFTNNGDEYLKEVSFYASTGNTASSSSSRALVGVKAGETVTGSFFFTPNTAGTWNLWLSDGTTTLGSVSVEIVTEANAKNANLSVNSISVANSSYGNRLEGTISIKNNGADTFHGNVKFQLWILAEEGGVAYSSSSATALFSDLEPGKSQSASYKFTNLIIGRQYFISVGYTTQSGNLTNGDINWSNPYELKDGVLRWSNLGQISGTAAGTTLTMSSTISGVLCDNVSPGTISAGRNPNTLYAFTNGAPVSDGLDGCNVVEDGYAEEINLSTGNAFYNPVDFTAEKAVFSHTFSAASDGVSCWETVTLPFKPDGVTIDGNEASWIKDGSDGAFYLREFGYQDDDGNVVFTDVENVESLRGNTPYVIAATEETAGKTVEFYADNVEFNATESAKSVVSTDEFLFYGTTMNVRLSDIYVLNSNGDAFEYTGDTNTVNAFETYFTTKLSEDKRPDKIYISSDGSTVKIDGVGNTPANGGDVFYDLQGRKTTNPGKGVYISNGKKYVK